MINIPSHVPRRGGPRIFYLCGELNIDITTVFESAFDDIFVEALAAEIDNLDITIMANGYLRVDGDRIVDGQGKEVILRGAAIGGWMNMENFITGYPGHEHQHRASMKKVLGEENYEYFFDKWLEYFFTDSDAAYFASLGLNCLRLPFNYRHFEDDMNPRVLKESGFKHLDRVVDICARHHIYTILDMHTAPGGHNGDWHSDNPSNYAQFWDYKDHQDRFIGLWEKIAARYKDNQWIAGYNPINEPCDPQHHRLPALYDRVEPAIRAVDPHHMLFLDGNTFAMEWVGFDKVLPNSVYAIHDYSTLGFPAGDRYEGTSEQKEKLERQFERKIEFQRKFKVPIWNGEFGPVYNDPRHDEDAAAANGARYELLGEQLRIYEKNRISWSIWLYKDIGVQGMLHTSPDSLWNRAIQPFLDNKKKPFQLDAWGKYPNEEAAAAFKPLLEWVEKICPQAKDAYPTPWTAERQLARAVVQTFVAAQFSDEFAGLFKNFRSKEDLDELARSFHFDQCMQREGLNKILREHATAHTG